MDRASLSAVLRWLAVGAVVAFVVVFAAGALGVRAVVRRIEQANNVQRVHRARALLARQAATRAVSIRELAWWTATWDYIDRPTTREAARFLKENFIDWLPRQYGDRFFGIWSLDRRRVFVWTDSGATDLAPLIEQPAHLEVVAREKSIGGLLADSGRLFLVSLSVVVRTEDQNATGPSHGYLATARPVTASLEREWGDGLQERIELSPTVGDEAARLGDSATTRTTGGDSVESRFALRDVFGHPAVVVRITGSRGYLAAPERWTMALIAAFALLGLVLIGVVWVVARHSVWRPLHRLATALQGMRASGRLASIDRPGGSLEWGAAIDAFNATVEALRAAEEQYRTLFRQAADALLVVEGPAQTILDANPAAERLAGATRGELVGRSLPEFLAPPPEGAAGRGTQLWLRSASAPATVEVRAGAVQAGPRQLTLVSVHDVTEREALEEQLRQSQRMEGLGRLAGGIAHDFNNLLAAVLVSANSLREDLGPDHPGQDQVRTIEHSSRRAAELTAQLLSFARRAPVRREPLAIDDLVANTRALCDRTFGHAVALVDRLEGGSATVMGDQGQLEQALLNLCLNARDAMPGGGTLTLGARVERPGEGERQPGRGSARPVAVLEVSDTGTGMPPDVLAHVFEPFFTTKERGKGTGLGLATTYGIVKAHGGVIRVHSEVGRGSRFEVRLPLAERPAVTSPALRDGSAPGGTETVLVVDDEIGLRRSVSRALERLGYSVIQTGSGEDGVARFAERPDAIGLVLLDVLMPGIGGVEAFRAIRRLRPQVRIVVMTGYASSAELDLLRQEGADAILAKPFSVPELATAIRAVLDGAEHAVGTV